MPDEPYSLSELARLADVTPRTIRYYVAQGLLPSPEAAGPATRYGEGHLLRLRLIRRLQRDHLPLSEIRARLERMGDEEVGTLLDAASALPAPQPAETLQFVRGLMSQSGIEPRVTPSGGGSLLKRIEPSFEAMAPAALLASAPAPSAPTDPASTSSAPLPTTSTTSTPSTVSAPVAPGARSQAGDRSTWERLVLTADVELHVRRPLDRQSNKRVEQLVRIARELFDEEP